VTAPALPHGFLAAGIRCGIKASSRGPDLGLLLADEARPASALFTRNQLTGAHVTVCREQLARSGGLVRAVLVNSGNANCATGAEGVEDARELSRALAARIGCPAEQVLMMSTGVIGARLPADRIGSALGDLVAAASAAGGEDFARAIMTTDTGPKTADATSESGATVTGFAKGSGMIHPDMATMLAFLLVDGADGPSDPNPTSGSSQRELLRRVTDRTFHCTTVDGDTSPNDTVLLWGRGAGPGLEDALTAVARRLARSIAADGEGATRLVTIHVTGGRDEAEATRIGRAVAVSPLVKTAIAGRDPNWGRIVSAACSAGIPVDPDRMTLAIGGSVVYRCGRPLPAAEPAAHAHLTEQREVEMALDLGIGTASSEVWTCDFTAEYVEINAHYRS
jgi:glutamate N-acetyltransferase / amino-acid N-acetyltransferase